MMASLSENTWGLRAACQTQDLKGLLDINNSVIKLLFIIIVIHSLFISTDTASGLTLTKEGNTFSAIFGDIITYDYELVNDDGIDLHDVVFYDDHFGSIEIGDFANGATWTHSLNHEIVEEDMPGPLSNKAWATGKEPDESVVRSTNASWDVALGIEGSLYVSKNPNAAIPPVGTTVNYTILVKNQFGFTTNNITLNDLIYHPSAISISVPLNRTTLLPNEVALGIVSYTVAQEDILGPPQGVTGHGLPKMTDYANAIGYPSWSDPTDPNAQSVGGVVVKTIGISYTTNQEVSKTASITQGAVGIQTTFNITVSNSGNVLLNRTELTDLLPNGLTFISASPAVTTSTNNVDGSTTLYWANLSQSFGTVLNPGQQFKIQVTASFSGSKYGKLTNTVTSKGYNLRRESKTSISSTDVFALKPDIAVVKIPDIATGSPNTVVNFTLLVQNTGNVSFENVSVSDLLPDGMSYVSSSPGSTNSGPNIYWSDIGSIGIGENRQLWVNARMNGPVVGTEILTNLVNLDGKPELGNNVTNSTTATVDAQEANISVIKTADPAFGSPSTNVTFTLDVTNSGDALLPHVFVSDLLPTGMSYVSSSPAGIHTGQNVSWPDIGPMEPDGNKQLQIVAHIDGPISGTKTLTNHVDVSGKPEHGQNVTVNASADVEAQEANISVTKTADPAFGSPSTNVTFTLDVTNSGDALLPHVFVSDLLPAGMSYVSSSPESIHTGQNVSWPDIGPMEPDGNKELQIVAHIDGPISGTKTLTNHVNVAGKPEHGQNVTANASAEVEAQEAEISVTKTADPASGSPSTNVTFTLDVTNSGDALLPHVFVSDLLPAGLSYVSSSPEGICTGQNVSWPDIGPLSSGSNKELQIVAHIDGPISGTRTLTNFVNVAGKPEHGQNVTANASAEVEAREAKISVTKTADPAFGSPSTNVTFTLDVTNSGDALLPHVFVSDLLPAGMSYVSSSPSGTHTGQNVSWLDIGPLSSGSNKELQIIAHIDGPISGTKTLTNHVNVAGKPEHGQNVTANASAEVEAQEAKISVTKTADPASGSPSTNVTFTLDVTNSGDALLPHVFVSDLLPAGLSYVSSSPSGTHTGQNVSWPDIGSLSSGSNKELQIVAHIDGPISGTRTLTNFVNVAGKPEHGQNVTANASAEVEAQEAKISVSKTADPIFGSPSTNVTFTLDVTNSGDALLPHVFVSDLLPAGLSYVSSSPEGTHTGQNVSWPDIGPLSSSSNKELQIVAHIDGPISGTRTLTNFVNVAGKPEHGQNVTANASAEVEAQEAKISVTKTADPIFGSPSTNVTFTLDVTNSGDALLPHVFVSDLLPAGISYVSSSPEGVHTGQNVSWPDIGPMEPDGNKELQIVAHIDGPISGTKTLTNFVNVAGKPEHGQNVTANASAEVEAQEAKISVSKTAYPASGSPSTNVTFTLDVTNSGDALLPHVFVSDFLPAGIKLRLVLSRRGTHTGQNVSWPDIGPLSSGSNKELQIVAHIDGPISGTRTLTNFVNVAGKPEHGQNVTANASAEVEAQEAKISVTKTADPIFGSPSTNVTFTLDVTNSGDALLPHVFVSDLLPAGISYVSSSPEGVHTGQNVSWPDIGPMEPDGNKELQIIAHIDAPISGTKTLTNFVNVAGKPEHGQNVTANASAEVEAQEAEISVTKTAYPASGSPSTNVTFTLDVTNSGDALLPHVFVSDFLPAGLSYVSSSPGGTHTGQNVSWPDIGPMEPESNKELQIVAHIDGPISGTKTLTNFVNVAGKPEHGQNVTANASAEIEAQEAKISVTKTADPIFGSPSTNVTFTLDVTNSGDALLPHVFVSDLLPSGMSYVSSLPEGTHTGQNVSWPDIGPLSSGSNKELQIIAHIDGPISGTKTLTNHVNVAGKPEHGQNVTANASAEVEAQEAKISVTKTADPIFGSPSTNVTFTLDVTNSGDALLPHVFVSDLLPAGMSYVSSSPSGTHTGQNVSWPDIGPMEPDGNKELQIVAHIDGPISGTKTLTNFVNVAGKPEHGQNVTANASADVVAQEAKISVSKTAYPASGSPSTNVTFTLQVTNSGDASLPHVFVSDLLPAGMSYVSSSPEGICTGQNVSWPDIGHMTSSSNKELQIVAHIDGPVSGTRTLTNFVNVAGKPEHGQNVTANASAEVEAREAKISVTKTANPIFGSPSTNVTFTLQVTNSGDASLPHVFVSDILPAGMSYVSSSPEGTHTGQNVSWPDIGPMEPESNKELQIVAHIDGPISGTRTLTNHVNVAGKPEHGQNVTANASADVQAQEAEISVSKTAYPASGSPSTNVTFTLQVTNSGDASLPHVFVSDLLPVGMSYVSSYPEGVHTGQNVSWPDIGHMTSGSNKELQIVAHIDGPISGTKTLTNHVNVAGKPEHGQNVTANDSAEVETQEAKISVTKTADPIFGSPSTNVTFTLQVTNSGDAPLPHVFVSDLLPVGLSYVSSSPSGTHIGQNVSWPDIGPMEPDGNKELQIVAHIDGPISGTKTLTNHVNVAGKPEHGQNVTANDSAEVEAQEAKISVTKTAYPASGSPSTNVTFTLLVTNRGDAPLPHVFVSDLLPAGLSYVSSSPEGVHTGQNVSWPDIGPMEPDGNKELQIVAHIDGPISGTRTLTNHVNVAGKPEHGQNVTANDSAEVEAQEAKISVTKTAYPVSGSPSTNVTFTLDVTNSGDAPLPHVFVSDLLPAGLSYVSSSPEGVHTGQNVSWPDIGPMEPDDNKQLQIVAHIDGPISGTKTLTNHVNVAGKPEHGQNVTANDSAEVETQEAKISVTKTAYPVSGSPSTNVTFTLDVTNSGDAPLPHVFVSDLLPAGLSYVSSSPEGVHTGQNVSWPDIGPMEPDGNKELQIVAHIDGPISGTKTLTNHVNVAGKPEHGQNVTANASAEVEAREAKISVSKTADPASGSPSTNVTFTLDVTNSGDAPLPHVFVSDLLPAGMSYVSSSPSGTHIGQNVSWPDIGPMEPDGNKELQIVAHIDGPISGTKTLTNHVNVAGKPEHGQNVTANASAEVEAQEAKISVSKTADPASGSPSTNVTFTLQVTNPGDAPLPHVFVSDLLPAGMSYVSSSPEGVHTGQNVSWPDIGPMEPDGNKELQIVAHIDGPISGTKTLTNFVNVAGKPDHGQNVTANASAEVLAQEAEISVTKTADPIFGSPSTNVTFTLDVTNSGDALLPHVFVSDLLPAGLSYVSSSPSGTHIGQNVSWPDIGPMEPDGNKELQIVAHIDGPISGTKTLTNHVNVAGKPEHGQNVTANASAEVEAQEAKISVTKTADPASGSPSTNVTFTLQVTNPGDAPLPHVFVSDLLPAGMSYVSSSPEGVHTGQNVSWPDIGPMEPDGNKELQIVAHIDGPISGTRTLTNHVNVAGKPEHGQNVTANASAEVEAQEAKISVTKTADPVSGSPSTNVTFTLQVTNSGDAPLPHVFVSDLLPAGLSYVSSSPEGVHTGQNVSWPDIGPMEPDGNKELQIVAHIDGPISGTRTLTNHVNVAGKPEHGQNVTANASAEVEAQEAKISVSKTADPASGSPSTNVTFTLDVTNSGDASLPHVFVSDLLPAGMSYVSSSPEGIHTGQNVSWPDIGPMEPDDNKQLQIVAHIDGPISGTRTLTNHVNVAGKPEHGQNVTANASAEVEAHEAKISVTKTADPTFGSSNTNVTFTLDIKNSGAAPLPHVFVSDLLPTGMSYVSSSPSGTHTGQNVSWPDIGPMEPDDNKQLQIVAHIDGPISGTRTLTNFVNVAGKPEHGQNVTANASAEVEAREAQISVTKTADPTFGSPSTNVTFTLLVTNSGDAPLPHVFVSDLLPVGMSYVSSSLEEVHTGQNISWSDIGPLSSGSHKELQIVAHIDGPISGTKKLTNQVDVSGKPEHGQNVTANASAEVEAQEAKISVTKTADPVSGSPSTNVTFTLLVTNSGDAPLPHVFVSDLLPAGMSYVSSSPSGTHTAQNISWPDIGPMEPDDNKQLQIVAHIDGPLSGTRTLTNHVNVAGKPEHGQNVTANASAEVEAQEAEISVTKTADPESGSKGTNVTFTLNVTNNGGAPLPHVFVSDQLPNGMIYESSSEGGVNNIRFINWTDIGPMAVGTSKSLWVRAKISGAVFGTLTNSVTATGKPEHGGDVTSSATADVDSNEASILVTKSANPVFGSKGALINFTLAVNNNGKSSLQHVFVSDQLPIGMIYDSSSEGGVNSVRFINWTDIGPMAIGASRTLWVKAKITGTVLGTMTNHVNVTGKPEYGDEVTSSAVADVISSQAKIVVAKSASPTLGSKGSLINFTLMVNNNGESSLSHVYVSDQLPTGLVCESFSAGGVSDGHYVNWTDIGPIVVGASRNLWIEARIDGTVIGTLKNCVNVTGKPEHGDDIESNATATVEAQTSGITVKKTAVPAEGVKEVIVTFPIEITNNETMKLSHVKAVDVLPLDMDYLSSGTTPAPTSAAKVGGHWIITWSDLGPLDSGESHKMNLVSRINGTALEQVTNEVNATAVPEFGEDVSAHDSANVLIQNAVINVTKNASQIDGVPGSIINYTVVINNTGSAELCQVSSMDVLPDGLQYEEDDHGGVLTESNKVVWDNLGCLLPGEEIEIQLKASITGTVLGNLDNTVTAQGIPRGSSEIVKNEAHVVVDAKPAPFIITKTSDKSTYRPGEEITYTITVCNPLEYISLEDVVVKDVFQNPGIRIVSSYPEPSEDGQWYFAEIPPKSCVTIKIVATYPKSNMSFDAMQSISGKGFVNVHNDLSTAVPSFLVTNCVYVTARVGSESWSRQTCVSVTIKEIGTELETREHGSGDFRTDEKTRMATENRSIESSKSVSAIYSPITFQLPNSRNLNYSSKWTEDSRGKNFVTGASMHETYRDATSLDRNSYLKLDENGSEMNIDSRFSGTGSIGFFKMPSPEAGSKEKPIFEAQEDYNGEFRLNESFKEYGANVVTEKSALGEGYVSSDKRLRDSQRTYEFGTGAYISEEKIDTFTNYMAKDIELAQKSGNFSNLQTIQADRDLKWSEGMWSKSGSIRGGDIVADKDSSGGKITEGCAPNNGTSPATLISERYSSLDYLKKDAVALGLNEMKSNATFKGIADYRAKAVSSNGNDQVDSEDRYVGEYGESRHILLTGVSKYDQPHIAVTKEGMIKSGWFNSINSTVAEYIISVTNDGNRALSPVYVRDLFPPGVQYINSSVLPSTLSATEANWTILYLGIGNTLTITLDLNVTEDAPGNLLNRVKVGGLAGSDFVSAADYSSLESSWLSCCMPLVAVDKKAQLDSQDPSVVHYTILVRNKANTSMAARLTDDLPGGMSLLEAYPTPESYDGNYVHWTLPDLGPNQVIAIEYTVRAARNGAYTNSVHLDASAIDGAGSDTSDASAYIDLSGTGVAAKTARYDGWQPPDWDMNTSEEGTSI